VISSTTSCSAGFQFLSGGCYQLTPMPDTWSNTVKSCTGLGGSLVTISSVSQNRWLFDYFMASNTKSDLWIGLSGVAGQSTFAWSDSSPLGFSYFAPGQPDSVGSCISTNFNSTCGVVKARSSYPLLGQWYSNPCSRVLRGLCAKPLLSSPTQMPSTVPSLIPSQQPTRICPSGFKAVLSDCYRLTPTADTWMNSVASCVSLGSSLATIKSEAESVAVYSAFSSNGNNIWIGLNDISSEGRHTWIEGSDSSYRNWMLGQPDNYLNDENCIHFWGAAGGSWNDISCSYLYFGVCKWTGSNVAENAGNG
jgi:hypothetical protein